MLQLQTHRLFNTPQTRNPQTHTHATVGGCRLNIKINTAVAEVMR
jgi:hypothetical protein